ncbi:unnamed protein product [Sphagnum jensenii]|uniref:Uncharacterized protein n=1 Tax=Sphagnum jensenii TaxID=128206 RepID=A0ABP0VB78_9BRYO
MKKSATEPSPYHALKSSLENIAGLQITGLLLEVADTINEVSLSLGAAVLFAKSDKAENWRLTVSNYKQMIKDERSSSDAIIVDCYIDELMGCHCLYPYSDAEDNVRLLTPYFDDDRRRDQWVKQLEASRARPAKEVPKVTVYTAKLYPIVLLLISVYRTSWMRQVFCGCDFQKKRACLRASGIFSLPRPREGPRKIDAIMIPLLDEEVAYEVLRRLGETRGDFKVAARMQGDTQRAKEMCEELNAIATTAIRSE